MSLQSLKQKLVKKRYKVLERYNYYEMKETAPNTGIVIPARLKQSHKSKLGWCTKAVDALADRLIFDGFNNDNFDLMALFNLNNPDILFDSAILSALISSCSFIYIAKDEDGEARMQVIDGANATGTIDPITGLLAEGYAVLKRGESQDIEMDAYFEPNKTTVYDYKNNSVTEYKHKVAYPLLVPIIYRADAKRPFGHSRISRACMNIQNKAKNVLTRGDIAAEFYSYPQKYVLGLSEDVEDSFETWKATISSMLSFGKDSDGDKPTVGQFTQQSMEPHISQFRMYASAFAGETGLTLDDLGFATENPSSAEAIKAAHEVLRLTAKKAQRSFGTGFLNAGFLARCLTDDFTYERKILYLTTPKWLPVFEPDSAMLSSIGDGAIKLNQAIDGFITSKNLSELTGIKGGE